MAANDGWTKKGTSQEADQQGEKMRNKEGQGVDNDVAEATTHDTHGIEVGRDQESTEGRR